MRNTLLLVFIHGFKGTDHTFHDFPRDLQKSLEQSLPKINVVSLQYPQFETRGDLQACVKSFGDWLQNRVIDLEVANETPSPTVDPSVHVILCGHSMGGIVAAEALLSIAKDELIPSFNPSVSANATTGAPGDGQTSSQESNRTISFFPSVRAVLAFDTPYLGISPGVLAHGAEEQGVTAYKAWDSASKLFGWNSPGSTSRATAPAAAGRGLPAADASNSNASKWGTYAMYGGAAAAIAGVAGAAYLNWGQINEGLTWASSHLEFVNCLAKGAELQKRVENVVHLTRTHDIGFTNFYGVLGEKVTSKTKYAGAFLGQSRTFCVVPKEAQNAGNPTGSKRDYASSAPDPQRTKRQKMQEEADMKAEMEDGERVYEFVENTSKSKGRWVKCVNHSASDEVAAHTTMFTPEKNPDYDDMVSRACDQIIEWIDPTWYERASNRNRPDDRQRQQHEGETSTSAAAEAAMD